jgi:hypothetical protein
VKFAVISIVIPNIAAGSSVPSTPAASPISCTPFGGCVRSTVPVSGAPASVVLTFQDQSSGNNTPLSQAQMLDPAYNFGAQMMLGSTTSGAAQTADARQMLQNSDYTLWTSGPVAQTIVLADDTATAKYDLGFDGYRPFRPRFYVTFWPTTHQVTVRYVGENGNTQALEDLNYNLILRAGNANPATVYTNSAVTHYSMSNWTKIFWLGGTPTPQININNSLAYLEQTRFLPNYDTGIAIPESTLQTVYGYWTDTTTRPRDLYDSSLWTSGMGTAGSRFEIAPYPEWSVLWLYTGDWRMRQMALGLADLASAFPANLREGDPTRRLSRADAPGSGTGLGHVVSVTDRKTLSTWVWAAAEPDPQDVPNFVGTVDFNQPWSFDGAHQPSPFYPQYILTGDPYYLNEMYMWAGFSAARYVAGASWGRGPTGAEGAIADELRGAGWVERNRAETAFAAPDGDPEKFYFTYLTNDALARWEGGLGVTGDAYTNTPMWQWGQAVGNHYADNGGPFNGEAPSLHNWESNGASPSLPAIDDGLGEFVPGAVGTETSFWTQYYVLYMLGRMAELGFASDTLLSYTGQWFAGMINSSGDPLIVALYVSPVEMTGGGYFSNWASFMSAITPSFLSSTLPQYFADNLFSDGRQVWAIPGASYLVNKPGGAQAWNWLKQNIYNAVPDFNTDPKWAIIPRTDNNILPPISTYMPPS